jgi:hypothetical protein
MLAPLRALVTVTVLLAFASAPAMARTIPTILIWQPDHTASESGEALLADLVVLGEDAALSDDLFAYSTDLSGHEIVIGVVGFTPDTHVLDATKGGAFETYVQNGGLLLLEGGDCFDYDPDVSGGYDVRPIFGLGTGSDGGHYSGDVVGVGDLGGFGFDFSYSGEPSFLDELNPVTSAAILRKATNDDVLGVFHAAFGDGRAIGLSCEYAGLSAASSATSRVGAVATVLTRRQELLVECLALLRTGGGSPTAAPNLAPRLALLPAAPNPFTARTTIGYNLPQDARTRVDIFDVRGRLVRTLVDRPESRGPHAIDWDGRDGAGNRVASGVYFFALNAGGIALHRRVVLLK